MGKRAIIAAWAGLAAGCYGGLDGFDADDEPNRVDGADGDADGDDGDGTDDDGGPAVDACGQPLVVPAAPMRRLTRGEYDATVRDLIGEDVAVADAFTADEVHGGFARNEAAVSNLQVEQYRLAAQTVAAAASSHFDAWLPCPHDDASCVADFVTDFGRRAYRRPLRADEEADYAALFAAQLQADGDADVALQLVVQTMLMSPHFVYHVEIGEPAPADATAVRLTDYEIASRLSYFLWGSMPDEALLDAAESGQLQTPEQREAQALRLLADPRAEDMLVDFGRQWMGLTHLHEVERDTTAFPDWSPDLIESMRIEAEAFFTQTVLHGDGRLHTLLTASHSYVDDDALAGLYGVAPSAAADGRVELPADERAGFLTQGAFLVAHAYPSENSWVHRGKFVRERLLCGEMPPPPADVDFTNTNDPNRLENPECAGCHVLMDPIGEGFDGYDATGRFVGPHIPGEVLGSDVGAFDTIAGLASSLADSEEVQTCMVEQLSGFALGRHLGEDEACTQSTMFERFAASGFDLRELMVAIVVSDAFAYRGTQQGSQ